MPKSTLSFYHFLSSRNFDLTCRQPYTFCLYLQPSQSIPPMWPEWSLENIIHSLTLLGFLFIIQNNTTFAISLKKLYRIWLEAIPPSHFMNVVGRILSPITSTHWHYSCDCAVFYGRGEIIWALKLKAEGEVRAIQNMKKTSPTFAGFEDEQRGDEPRNSGGF